MAQHDDNSAHTDTNNNSDVEIQVDHVDVQQPSRQASNTTVSLHQLPQELLLEICEYLPHKELSRKSLVSHAFYKACTNDALWQQATIVKFNRFKVNNRDYDKITSCFTPSGATTDITVEREPLNFHIGYVLCRALIGIRLCYSTIFV